MPLLYYRVLFHTGTFPGITFTTTLRRFLPAGGAGAIALYAISCFHGLLVGIPAGHTFYHYMTACRAFNSHLPVLPAVL